MTQKTFFNQAIFLSVFFHLILIPCLGVFLNSQLTASHPEKRIELELIKTAAAKALDNNQMAAEPLKPKEPERRRSFTPPQSQNKIVEDRKVEPIAKNESAVVDKVVPAALPDAAAAAQSINTGEPAAATENVGTAAAGGSGQAVQSGEYLRPQLLSGTEPPYPEAAKKAGRKGTVAVSLEVLANGQVGSVTVTQSSGHADLDAAAVRAVKRWRFAPAKDSLSGRPVSCFVNFPVVFQIK